MIKMKDLLDQSNQKGHISRHNPAKAFAPEVKVDEGIADDDMKAADKIHGKLKSAIEGIDTGMALINKNLSSFNSPGLRHAFTKAIASATSQGKFDVRKAHTILNNYYSR